ncbi:MAG: DUF3159 domain-containing protein [Dehalococcoidia bacterium]
MNLRVFLSIAPVLAFLAVSRAADPWVAVAAGFGASVLVFVFTRRDRLIGVLSLFGLTVVGVSAALGVVWNSERAYLASGPASDFLFVPLYVASVWLRRPLVGSIVHELFPRRFATVPANHDVFMRLSLAWAGFDVVHGVVLTTLLLNFSVLEYVVWSRVLGWPMTGTMLVLSFLTVQRTAK